MNMCMRFAGGCGVHHLNGRPHQLGFEAGGGDDSQIRTPHGFLSNRDVDLLEGVPRCL